MLYLGNYRLHERTIQHHDLKLWPRAPYKGTKKIRASNGREANAKAQLYGEEIKATLINLWVYEPGKSPYALEPIEIAGDV